MVKTHSKVAAKAYRQVGNAFPPPVASSIGLAIAKAFDRPVTNVQIPQLD